MLHMIVIMKQIIPRWIWCVCACVCVCACACVCVHIAWLNITVKVFLSHSGEQEGSSEEMGL